MNSDKMGLFIKSLREKANLSQQDLANKCNISRQAVSKWERGVTIPEAFTLVLLSQEFKVSINELLAGEYESSETKELVQNITLDLLEEDKHKGRLIKILLALILGLMLIFFSYYFLNSYNKFQVYLLKGKENNQTVVDGILVHAQDTLYLRLTPRYKFAKIMEIRVLGKEKEEVIFENKRPDLGEIDILGFKKEIKKAEFLKIIKNLILEITYEDKTTKKLKLEVQKDYQNNRLIFTNLVSSEVDKSDSIKIDLEKKKANIIDNMGVVSFALKLDDLELVYKREEGVICLKNGEEEYIWDFKRDEIHYVKKEQGKIIEEFRIDKEGKCEGKECKDMGIIENEFFNKIERMI